MISKIQVSISFHNILELIPEYAKFMKEFLLRKKKSTLGENVVLTEKCSAIIQRKLSPNLKDPGRFTIPCTIREVKIPHTLYDLGANINLMSLALVKKLKLGEPKHTNMTLTLIDLSTTHPYGVIKDVLVKMDELVFLTNFVIVDINEKYAALVILGRHFLATEKNID
ncbi:uncharacterized protein LOC127107199 [Lathyrus oleraceus]|uniref:uncharacterized protein LOC127107199 n=1 Tax=Pisum sativum TaxID=3888 RepID=UPI0021D08363|nr:uncharacterized protein LOC127107199 [Pisum sativum]